MQNFKGVLELEAGGCYYWENSSLQLSLSPSSLGSKSKMMRRMLMIAKIMKMIRAALPSFNSR